MSKKTSKAYYPTSAGFLRDLKEECERHNMPFNSIQQGFEKSYLGHLLNSDDYRRFAATGNCDTIPLKPNLRQRVKHQFYMSRTPLAFAFMFGQDSVSEFMYDWFQEAKDHKSTTAFTPYCVHRITGRDESRDYAVELDLSMILGASTVNVGAMSSDRIPKHVAELPFAAYTAHLNLPAEAYTEALPIYEFWTNGVPNTVPFDVQIARLDSVTTHLGYDRVLNALPYPDQNHALAWEMLRICWQIGRDYSYEAIHAGYSPAELHRLMRMGFDYDTAFTAIKEDIDDATLMSFLDDQIQQVS